MNEYTMVTLATVVIGSYLVGSVPFGYLVGQLAGVDIRKLGSGNVGATNVVRVLGRKYGYAVFGLDFLKGLAAVKISMLCARGQQWNSPEIFGIAAAVACVIGHSYPVWLRFSGGKGVATSAGALFALTPIGGIIAFGIWAVVFLITRYVSVASVTAAVVVPCVILVMSWHGQTRTPIFYFAICIAAVVIWRHRTNLSRLIRGTEPRFTRK